MISDDCKPENQSRLTGHRWCRGEGCDCWCHLPCADCESHDSGEEA